MAIENRKLPAAIRYLTLRLTGRPLYAFLWIIWEILASILLLVQKPFTRGSDALEARIGALILIVILGIVLIAFLSVLTRGSARVWLMEKYHDDETETVTSGSCLVVRLVPLVALIAVLEYWLVG